MLALPHGGLTPDSRLMQALSSSDPLVRELAGAVLLRLLKYEPRVGTLRSNISSPLLFCSSYLFLSVKSRDGCGQLTFF
jgi:hypothetical protein